LDARGQRCLAAELAHLRGRVGPWGNLCDELLDLPLGFVCRTLEQAIRVPTVEVGGEPDYSAQVQTAVPEHCQDLWELAGRTCHDDAEIGFGFREVKDLHAVDEQRRGGFTRVQSALVDLADVGNDVGLDSAGLADELDQAPKKLVVANRFEWTLSVHDHGEHCRARAGQERSVP
jgi:hypothetical protein